MSVVWQAVTLGRNRTGGRQCLEALAAERLCATALNVKIFRS